MSEFDARLSPARYAPAVLGSAAVLLAAGGGVGAVSALSATAGPQIAPRSASAPRAAASPAGPVLMPMRVARGETLLAAVRRTGVAADEAREVVALLGQALDVVNIRAGLAFQAAVARPTPAAPARLLNLSMKTGPAREVTLSRAPDGALSLKQMEERLRDETHVASGVMKGSLYESALRAGATPGLVTQATKLFSKTLDFARDIQPGDPFRLVFDRTVGADGRTVETGQLLYAEIGAKGRTTRFYRFEHEGKVEFTDEVGQELKPLLVKTPVEGGHVTSSFGMRLHPLLGFNRLHPGVDFGAPTGTPVVAAGDGVVEEARWAGGYGHWLKLRHAQGYETGYGHLSRYAPGMKPGAAVKQGQVVAYVGSTGLSTGPHLHYEVLLGGKKLDPHGMKTPQAGVMNAAAIAAFAAQKSRIDTLLARDGGVAPLRTAALERGPALR